MVRRLTVVPLALCVCASALAAEIGGIRLDDKVSVGGQELLLNGAGVRTKLMFRIYVAGLYLPQKAADLASVLAKGPRRVQMTLLRNVTADELIGAFVEGLNANNSPPEMAAVKAQTDQLVAIMKAFRAVKEKDVVVLDFVDGGTTIVFNGEARGTIPGAGFNAALMRIWLGDQPAQPDLRKAMLGA